MNLDPIVNSAALRVASENSRTALRSPAILRSRRMSTRSKPARRRSSAIAAASIAGFGSAGTLR